VWYAPSILNIVLDEGAEWYVADHCSSFSEQTIANGGFEPLFDFSGGNFTTFPRDVTVGECFFLGVNTGVGFGPLPALEPNRDFFGWGEFVVDGNGDLLVLDSAVNYGPGGIVIGKSQVASVPEPSGCCVTLLVGTLFCSHRRRRS